MQVEIQIVQLVSYSRIVEMDEAQFLEYEERLNSAMSAAGDEEEKLADELDDKFRICSDENWLDARDSEVVCLQRLE